MKDIDDYFMMEMQNIENDEEEQWESWYLFKIEKTQRISYIFVLKIHYGKDYSMKYHS